MAGDQDGLAPLIAQRPDEGAHLRDADGVQAVDGLVQNQQLRVVHHRQGDGQPLLHTQGVLEKELFIPVGQSYQIQGVLNSPLIFQSPQGSENAQVLRSRQVGIKAGGFNQAADAGQQLLLIAQQGLPPDRHLP